MTDTVDFGGDFTAMGHLRSRKQAEQMGDAVLLEADGCIPASFVRGASWRYGLAFDPTAFETDPTGSLTYSEGCSMHRPVSNLGNILDVGTWGMTDAMLRDDFYATINGAGDILHTLDPYDLSKDVNGVDVSAEIATENVMYCAKLCYTKRNASGILHSSNINDGEAYAHTLGGHKYNYLAIPVYKGTIIDGKLKSVSGHQPTYNETRGTFRTAAQANGENWHLINFHERQFMRDRILFALKSFDSQRRIGNGYSVGGTTENPAGLVSGQLDQAGPFAGNVTAVNQPVKCFVENFWGDKWEFIDDFVVDVGREDEDGKWVDVYAGQNVLADDLLTSKTKIASLPVTDLTVSTNFFATKIKTDDVDWGLWDNNAGSDSTGLCDRHWSFPTAQRLGFAGGSSRNGSAGGVSALSLDVFLSIRNWFLGARAAFVFD